MSMVITKTYSTLLCSYLSTASPTPPFCSLLASSPSRPLISPAINKLTQHGKATPPKDVLDLLTAWDDLTNFVDVDCFIIKHIADIIEV